MDREREKERDEEIKSVHFCSILYARSATSALATMIAISIVICAAPPPIVWADDMPPVDDDDDDEEDEDDEL